MSSSEAHAVGRQPVNPHDITHIAVVVTSTLTTSKLRHWRGNTTVRALNTSDRRPVTNDISLGIQYIFFLCYSLELDNVGYTHTPRIL